MTRVKICGITTREDAQVAVEAGADMVGLIFYPRVRAMSPQHRRTVLWPIYRRPAVRWVCLSMKAWTRSRR